MDQRIISYLETVSEVADAAAGRETFWINSHKCREEKVRKGDITPELIEDGAKRLERFAPYLAAVFPETQPTQGIIESPLQEIAKMKTSLNQNWQAGISGRLLLKMDSHLPISGSIKARGGIYEVLKHGEELAMEAGLLTKQDDYRKLASPQMQEFFSQYTVQVGSTGNLGLSIGIMSAKLGFHVIVHMSADAKKWKKELLRSKGVTVMEYETDYCAAVAQGRLHSDNNPMSYFVDDENSQDLFIGYAVAAARLEKQLERQQIKVDETHPLFVYLPCGIGGAPGGVAYGLKEIYGDAVHCFFTEPTQACCMLLGMATGEHDGVCVRDFGIPGRTDADGLAVGRPSAFVGRVIEQRLSGICTIADGKLYDLMRMLLKTEDIFIEPSACAAFAPFIHQQKMDRYIRQAGLDGCRSQITHIAWATGGKMVPQEMVDTYLNTYK